MDLSEVRMNAFFGDEVFYDLEERNYIVASQQEADEDEASEYESGTGADDDPGVSLENRA